MWIIFQVYYLFLVEAKVDMGGWMLWVYDNLGYVEKVFQKETNFPKFSKMIYKIWHCLEATNKNLRGREALWSNVSSFKWQSDVII